MKYEVAIIGAGYVGLPLAHTFGEAGVQTVLVDTSVERVEKINSGTSYVEDVPEEHFKRLVENQTITATTDYDAVCECNSIIIALPTPLTPSREPDISIVKTAALELAKRLRKGHLIILESTTYPGTTREEILPILATSGLTVGIDFFLAFSPERVDPGRVDWTTKNTPKVVGGVTNTCTDQALKLYNRVLDTLIPVTSPEVAELTKLLENIFRSVNIALVNELAQLCARMEIDVWEVVEAAATKPFGFMSFRPGPGLGGHCLPVDPFYLSWKARQYDFYTEFIELAGKINENMPYFCIERIAQALNSQERSIRGSHIHLVGVAYKENVSDLRESPALKLIELLQREGAHISYTDKLIPKLSEYNLATSSLENAITNADCICIVTQHSDIDYKSISENAKLIVDLRNATGANNTHHENIWKL